MQADKNDTGLYFHVGNGGISFHVIDNGFGPQLKINTSFLGNMDNTLLAHLEPGCLMQLSNFFAEAAKKTYSKTYCNAAKEERHLDISICSSKGD